MMQEYEDGIFYTVIHPTTKGQHTDNGTSLVVVYHQNTNTWYSEYRSKSQHKNRERAIKILKAIVDLKVWYGMALQSFDGLSDETRNILISKTNTLFDKGVEDIKNSHGVI